VTYVAKVKQVLRQNIHTVGSIVDGEVHTVTSMPLPDRIEIHSDGSETQPCMMYRYTNDGQFCGDTWHETLEAAFQQAEFEYGLTHSDFELIHRT
jgi:hypothetical protein